MVKSRVFGFNVFGDINVLKEITTDLRLSTNRNVLIQTEHISVNPVEVSIRKGLFSTAPSPKSFRVLGNEIQGIVRQIDSQNSTLQIGDSVLAYIPSGGDADFVAVNESKVFKLPKKMPAEVAAGFPMIATTAYWTLTPHFFPVTSNTKLAIVGASGSVGSLILQLAKQKGATVLASASKSNKEYLEELGANFFVDYRNQDHIESFKGWADYVINASLFNAGEILAVTLLKQNGTYLGLNALPDLSTRPDITAFFMEKTAEMNDQEALEELLSIYNKVGLKLRIGHLLPFTLESLKEAHLLIETNQSKGKIILKR